MTDIRVVRWLTDVGLQSAEEALDAYVVQHPHGSPYHLSGWRNAVAEGYGHDQGCLVAYGQGGQIAGLLPLCYVRRPLVRPQWVSLPFADLGGPLADDKVTEQALIQAAQRELAASSAERLELRCHSMVMSEPSASGVDLTGRKVHMLCTLPESSASLLASYKPKLRSQIKKAEKNGLQAEIRTDAAAVTAFYTVYATNMRRLGSPAHSKRWFEAIQRQYQKGQSHFIVLVRSGDRVVGAGWVLRCAERAVIPWASTLADFNHLAPNMLLYWTIQAHLADSGGREFDFGRSTYGEGTYRFKQQWGAVPNLLDWQTYTADALLPVPALKQGGLGQRLRPFIERVWQRLPQPVANRLGGHLRRYITL